MCSTENKETRLGKTLGSVRATDKGRRNKREQKNTKPKKKRKGLHKDRKGDFKGFIICEFASSWTIGRKLANYEQGGKGRKTKKNEKKKGDDGIINCLLYVRAYIIYILARKGIKGGISFCSFTQSLYLCITAKRAGKKASSKNRHLKHGINIPYDRREKKARQD